MEGTLELGLQVGSLWKKCACVQKLPSPKNVNLVEYRS